MKMLPIPPTENTAQYPCVRSTDHHIGTAGSHRSVAPAPHFERVGIPGECGHGDSNSTILWVAHFFPILLPACCPGTMPGPTHFTKDGSPGGLRQSRVCRVTKGAHRAAHSKRSPLSPKDGLRCTPAGKTTHWGAAPRLTSNHTHPASDRVLRFTPPLGPCGV